ncbi:MAG: hypothetical protein WD059_06275 [Balneolaceae bacterium]
MATSFHWKKGTFSSTYNLFAGTNWVGELRENMLSQSAVGMLNEQKYEFKTNGSLNQKTEIRDISKGTAVGSITYNAIRTKAEINLYGKKFTWSFDNVWSSKWSISNSREIIIDYQGSSSKGKIEASTNNELLLLSGLYITNYYWQITTVLIIIICILII